MSVKVLKTYNRKKNENNIVRQSNMKKIDYSIFSWIGVLGILLRKESPWFLLLSLFFILALVPKERELRKKEYREFYKTEFLSHFNPFFLFQILKQIIGEGILRIYKKNNTKTKNKYILPFYGKWYVYNGGTTNENSHSWDLLSQRFAYDFVIQHDGKSFRNDKTNIHHYYSFNEPIIAAFAGKVVSINNCTDDYKKVGDYSIDWKTNNLAGNYIIIEHPNNEFSLYAHLKRNSIKVNVNENVKQGQIIALCGNSGRSTEPHLHFQIMDKKSLYFGKSLIIRFNDVIDKNGDNVEYIEKEMEVKNKTGYQ